ncbi:MAG TPA: tetraacyldisaccharide 4'-kinase [Candidatus Angelobacter sp.]
MNPASALFGGIVRLRNALYDRGILGVHKLARPVISVGNISVGGSGKTPFVISFGHLLMERGIKLDILSRGYGRESKAVAIVDPNGSPDQFGDEPLLIARKLGAPVIVGADRYKAGLLAEQKFPQSTLHLLDDAFQHRRLHRDFDIVLVGEEDARESLLPAGRLREPVSALTRADAVVLPSASTVTIPGKTAWQMRRNIQVEGSMNRVVAFCGLARPAQFFAALKDSGIQLLETIIFPDHHRYRQSDVQRLLESRKRTEAQGFITTEKDAINLGALSKQLPGCETAILQLELENATEAVAALLRTLEQRCGFRASS